MEQLQEAVKYQAYYYDQCYTPKQYNVSEKVLLSSKNIRTSRPSKKLGNRFLGPFEIIEIVGKQAYRLSLPQLYKSIHPVFHVSLLEPYHRRVGEDPPESEQVTLQATDDEYEVEAILDERKRRGKSQYLIKWLGYPDTENSWEHESNLQYAKVLLNAFKKRYRTDANPTPLG